jgi:hypothetical protein
MSKSVFSQVGYPKIIVYKSDTLVAITQIQAKFINLTKVELDRYKELNINLQDQLDKKDIVIVNLNTIVKALEKDGANYKQIIANKDQIESSLKAELKSKNKALKWAKTKNGLLGISTIALGVLYIVKILF